MRYLLILLALPVLAQVPDYGRVAVPGAAYDLTVATRTMPIKAGLTSATPSTCTASKELYVKTDATAGQQLFICNSAGNGFNLVGDGVGSSLPDQAGNSGKYLTTNGTTASWATVSGGSGAVNTGAGNGVWWPHGMPGSTDAVNLNGGNAGYGRRIQIIVPVAMEFRSINFWINVAAGAGKTFQAAVYTADMATQVAYTTAATSGGTPDINTTGAARHMFSGGSMVSAGVLTITPGVYWVVVATDATAMVLMANGSGLTHILADATTTTGETHSAATRTLMGALSGASISTAGVLTANLSGATWNAPSQSEKTPLFCFVN